MLGFKLGNLRKMLGITVVKCIWLKNLVNLSEICDVSLPVIILGDMAFENKVSIKNFGVSSHSFWLKYMEQIYIKRHGIKKPVY